MSDISLPTNWVEVPLNELLAEVSSLDASRTPQEQFTYFDISSIDNEGGIVKQPKHVLGEDAPSRARQAVREGDVLFSTVRPSLRAIAQVPSAINPVASTGFCVLRAMKGIEPKYLYYIARSDWFLQKVLPLQRGVSYPAVRDKDVTSQIVPLAPSSEQTRIVEKLEELLSDLDAGVAELKAAQKKLAQYRQALLKAAVEGALTAEWRTHNTPKESGAQLLDRILHERRQRWEEKQLAKFKDQGKTPPKGWQDKYPEPVQPDTTGLPQLPEGWVWASVDQLSVVVRGASPRPAGDPRYFGGNIPWITVGSLTADDSMYLNAVGQFVTEAGRDVSRFIDAGTLLLTNSGATLGVPKITNIGGCINDGSVALLDVDEPLKIYLYWYLRTQTAVLRATNQGAAQPNLNTDIVRRICIPVCPFAEMSRINDLLDTQVDAIEEQRRSIATALKQSSAQRKNILKAAFSGQLVPQDPSDEPASVLLERIRAERAAAPKAQRGRRKMEMDEDLPMVAEPKAAYRRRKAKERA